MSLGDGWPKATPSESDSLGRGWGPGIQISKSHPDSCHQGKFVDNCGQRGLRSVLQHVKVNILDLLLIDVLTDTHSYIKCHICT